MSQSELIRKEIQRLHDKGSGDWQGLSRQVLNAYKPIEYNLPQLLAAKASLRHKWLFLEWGRGTGKTTYIGHHIRQIVYSMARSNGLFIGPTYQKILTQILPSMIQGLEQQGLYQGLHYFIGRRPPKSWNWTLPFQPPTRFDKYIIFYNGTGGNLISHDVPGDGRGLNTDWEVGDESALLKKNLLDENTSPTLRGSNKREFGNSPFFTSRLHGSSTPLTQSGQWFIDMEAEAIKNPEKIKFISADCRFNLQNLSDTYMEDNKANTLPWIFDAEYLNIRPRQIKGGFYPLLDEDKHTYNNFNYSHYHRVGQEIDCRGDADLVAAKPLIVGVDWGATINCLVACQHLNKELRALKSMYVLGDLKEIQSDLFDRFDKYYRHHPTKTIFLWYDNSGNVNTGIDKYTRAQMAKRQLDALGWTVRLMTVGGRNPEHGPKQLLWTEILKEQNHRLPVFRMNKSNCTELWISMLNAKSMPGTNGEIKKDKRPEHSTVIPRQHATDLSDAADAIVYGMFRGLLTNIGFSLPELKVKSS